jgi:endonuclease YncB( thermonuclease family)
LNTKAKAVHIIDGKTFVISPSWHWRRREENRIRAAGYYCPEIGEPGWEMARSRLEELILYGDIELKNPGEIELGVLLCDVYLEGINIADYFLDFWK